jgi:hypothetical protein
MTMKDIMVKQLHLTLVILIQIVIVFKPGELDN